jgi:hypothetical protein
MRQRPERQLMRDSGRFRSGPRPAHEQCQVAGPHDRTDAFRGVSYQGDSARCCGPRRSVVAQSQQQGGRSERRGQGESETTGTPVNSRSTAASRDQSGLQQNPRTRVRRSR